MTSLQDRAPGPPPSERPRGSPPAAFPHQAQPGRGLPRVRTRPADAQPGLSRAIARRCTRGLFWAWLASLGAGGPALAQDLALGASVQSLLAYARAQSPVAARRPGE